MNRRSFVILSATSSLTACAPRAMFSPIEPQPNATQQQIFVVTDRVVDAQLLTTDARAVETSNLRVDVQIPASHQTGQVEYPVVGHNNTEKFGVNSALHFDDDAALIQALNQHDSGNDAIVVYVHGYNNNLAESVYRHAQIANDFGLNEPQLTFGWSSAGNALGYAYDRDSAIIARDKLERLLTLLAKGQSRQIVLLAHSLGSMLTVETLRQMAIGGNTYPFGRFAAIALISPDIDVDVFRSQVERISPLPQPFMLFVSKNDNILRLSAGLTGKQARLGSTEDIEDLQKRGFSVIDLSDFTDGQTGDHFAAVTSPTAIAMLQGILAHGMPSEYREQAQLNLAGIIFEPRR